MRRWRCPPSNTYSLTALLSRRRNGGDDHDDEDDHRRLLDCSTNGTEWTRNLSIITWIFRQILFCSFIYWDIHRETLTRLFSPLTQPYYYFLLWVQNQEKIYKEKWMESGNSSVENVKDRFTCSSYQSLSYITSSHKHQVMSTRVIQFNILWWNLLGSWDGSCTVPLFPPVIYACMGLRLRLARPGKSVIMACH